MATFASKLYHFAQILCVLAPSRSQSTQDPRRHSCYYFNNATYLLSDNNLDWKETSKYCRRFHGHLPTPRNKVQVEFLSNNINWSNFNGQRYWIGLVGPSWTWSDGSPLTFANWGHKQPSPKIPGVDTCAYVNVAQQHKWEDMTCTEKKNTGAVCHLEGHAWSPWSEWNDCNCNTYIQQRTRICGTFGEVRHICPCPGPNIEMKICSCLSRWKEFRKDNSASTSYVLIKRVFAENLVFCSVFCVQETFCYRFSLLRGNVCNLYARGNASPIQTNTNDMGVAYVAVDGGKWISRL